ncbi:hypothetical protein O181_045401 [Austropuccinia psidii MF-1]|uniref:Integrase catalytic domain-containing protein n=1 Tax=Austropuccinia psidii MF-1 TaxID=1389203 RepID=A0A9Q3DS94_9BASI|nr:hypothetical protein [Austropuccinia psidii MF-1]
MGPFPISFDTKLYGMLMKDDFSSLVTFYPLKSKSNTPQLLINWITQFKNLTLHSIQRVRTDNTGEYLSNFLKNLFNQKGIVHETIIPYEHNKAGKIERTNCTIAKAAHSMIFNSGLLSVIWPYAFRHACWVFNWLIHAGQDRTPYELMTTRKSNLAPLQVFGCKAYVHNLTHQKNVTPKSRQLVHLGIAKNSECWSFWDKVNQSIVHSALVVFYEWSIHHQSLNAIEVQSLLDPSMVKELNGKDKSIKLFSATASLRSDSPRNFDKAMKDENGHAWKEAMDTELASLEMMKVWNEVPENQANQVLHEHYTQALGSTGSSNSLHERVDRQGTGYTIGKTGQEFDGAQEDKLVWLLQLVKR